MQFRAKTKAPLDQRAGPCASLKHSTRKGQSRRITLPATRHDGDLVCQCSVQISMSAGSPANRQRAISGELGRGQGVWGVALCLGVKRVLLSFLFCALRRLSPSLCFAHRIRDAISSRLAALRAAGRPCGQLVADRISGISFLFTPSSAGRGPSGPLGFGLPAGGQSPAGSPAARGHAKAPSLRQEPKHHPHPPPPTARSAARATAHPQRVRSGAKDV